MAAPHVTGALALYASYNTAANAAGLRSAILGNTKVTTSLAGKTATGGRLSLEGLFSAVAAPPAVSIADARVVEGNSGTTNATFAVTLSEAAASSVTVNYATANGSAVAGSDYIAGSGTVTFAVGETSKTVSVGVVGDGTVESDEIFTVTLSNPSGATLSRTVATGTIANDDVVSTPGATYDPTVLSVSAPLTTTRNRNNTVSITVGNLGNTAVQASVSLSSAFGTPGASTTVLVPAGGSVTTRIPWKSPGVRGAFSLTATTQVASATLTDADPSNNTKSVNITIR